MCITSGGGWDHDPFQKETKRTKKDGKTKSKEFREFYANRLRGREDLRRFIRQQRNSGCMGACDKCPLGSTTKHPQHFSCIVGLVEEIVKKLVPISEACPYCGRDLDP